LLKRGHFISRAKQVQGVKNWRVFGYFDNQKVSVDLLAHRKQRASDHVITP